MKKNKVQIEVNEKDYTLELDRDTIIYTEEILGYSFAKHDDMPTVSSYKLFAGALQKHHGELSIEERADLFDKYKDEGGDTTEVIQHIFTTYFLFSQTTQKPTKTLKHI